MFISISDKQKLPICESEYILFWQAMGSGLNLL